MHKFRVCLVLCFIAIIGIITVTIFNNGTNLYNMTIGMTATIANQVDPYETEYVYDDSMPETATPVVIEEGINGLDYTYDGLSYIHISDKKNEVVKVGTGKSGEYIGTLTGYGPDCDGCSSQGHVSCLTREKKVHSLITDGLYYNDVDYGSLRILAADNSAFPCGTIVKVSNNRLSEFYGIVLDTGITMRNAWKQGVVWMDLAFSSENDATVGAVTNKNTKFSVQRWGW